MKNSMKFLIVFLLIINSVSCESDDSDAGVREPYYSFNSDDEQLLIKYNYVPNQIITYINQDGEELNFKVISNERKVKINYTMGTFSGGGGSFQNTYDSNIVRFEIVENENYTEKGIVKYIFSKNDNIFKFGIHFPLWNKFSATFIDDTENWTNINKSTFSDLNQTTLLVNNHPYTKVIIAESDSNETYDYFDNIAYGSLAKNVNKVFYDYDFGIIRFENTNGDVWEVIYPE